MPRGEYGTNAMPCSWRQGSTSVIQSRVHSSDCTAVIGWTDCARLICSTLTSDRPMARALPAATVSARAPTLSSIGTCGSVRCR
ncbi:hypothetical protein OV320_1420 [Actinobacteria bacterium OV320]|nr:hypothetical protein OV320_1420 [Actinobacteria bacterium OV320]